MTEPKQPQVEPVPGAEAEPKVEPEVKEPGVEEEPQAKPGEEKKPPAERTYSQKEWSERESAKDTEISTYKGIASQAAMQAQIAQQQQTEATAKAKDQSDVDQGLITEAEAQQRLQGRATAFQTQQQRQMRDVQMQPIRERTARVQVADLLGERYGVDPYALLKDASITGPEQMEAKAKQLAKTKSDTEKQTVSDEIAGLKAKLKAIEEGEPFYDQGQLGTAGPAVDKMSPEEKIKYGLAHPAKTKKT